MLLIKNGNVVTMERRGVLEGYDVLIDQGKIKKIAKNINAKCEKINAKGLYVLPGLVDAHSHVGGFAYATMDQDLNEITDPVTADLNSYYGINPKDPMFKHIAEYGITTSGVIPGSANVVCGWGVAIKSLGKNLDSRVIKNPIALKAAMGLNPKGCYGPQHRRPGSRMGIAEVLREYFNQVKDYMKEKEEGKKDPKKMPKYNLTLEHGIPVLEKKIPLKVHSYHQDMLTVLRVADEFDFNVTLDHALGASDFYDEIASNKHVHGVIFGPVGSPVMPGELCKLDFDCLDGLDKRGVRVSVMTDGPITNCHILVDEAGEAVRQGMDPWRALRMITKNAAEILLCDNRVGSLKEGKDADILLYDGFPTKDVWAENKCTIIDGKVVYKNL